MANVTNVTIRHIGICVADIERSSRFYTGALGFPRH
ncbi:MAG: VOC family protein [Haliea sp.]|nr:VOC family protein [Haliea sp.]